MRYLPRLRDGRPAPLPWPVAIYRGINHIIWPLEDGASHRGVLLERFKIFMGFVIFNFTNEVDFHYLVLNRNDIDKMLTGMPTALVLIEIMIRGFQLALNKDAFKRLLQKFYADIYVTKESEPQLFSSIQKQMFLTRLNAFAYIVALGNFFVVPVQNYRYNRRDMLYQQVYFFDNTKMYFYIPCLIINYYVGSMIVSMIFGELNVIGELLTHLNARYIMLCRDMSELAKKLLENGNPAELAANFRRELLQIVRRHVALNQFAEEMENEFSFRIFFMFAFSAILLCAMGFKAYTNPSANIAYIVWGAAKFCQLLAVGMLGSILHKTTDDISVMYYCCGWELIIYHSTNTRENVQLMKFVTMAIEINSRPFFLTGLKYFSVTLATVIKIIQGAFSYFTFLTKMR